MSFPKHTQGSECEGCNERLKEGHVLIQSLFHQLKDKHPELHCSWVYRGPEDQELFFRSGASRARFGESKHNLKPSEAVDLFQITQKGTALFDPIYCARLNQEAKTLGFKVRWGGDFKTIGDSGHFELEDQPHGA